MFASRSAKPLPTLSFFGDSSSKDGPYMVLGGFAINGDRLAEVEAKIESIRIEHGVGAEFHWQQYKGGRRRHGYEALVDYAFELVANNHAHFHVILTPFSRFNHKVASKKDEVDITLGADRSINRIYWQLLLHRIARYYGKRCAIHVRLDIGNDSADIIEKRVQLCATAYKKYKTKPNCIRSIIAMNSKSSGIIQMSDVICGAIAAERNERNQSAHKTALRAYVLDKHVNDSWAIDTPSNAGRRFTVWNFKV